MKKITILIYLLFLTGCGASVDQRYQEVPAPETPPPSETTPPSIQLSTTGLSFASGSCGTNPASQTFEITNAGDGTLAWSASNLPSWLLLSPLQGTAPTTVTAQIDTQNLACGQTLSQTINIDAPGASNTPAALMVTLSIPNPPSPPIPAIITDKLKVSFTASSCGGIATSTSPTFTISSDGNGSFNWSGAATQSWIQFAPLSGTDGSTVTVSNIDTAALPCGTTSSGTITVSSAEAGNSPQSVAVEVTVPSAATINPSNSSLGIFATSCKTNPDPQQFTIENNGETTLGWSAAVTYGGATGWLSLDLTSGTVAANTTSADITVTVDASTLSCGQGYSATITLMAISGGSAVSPVASKTIHVGFSHARSWEYQNPQPAGSRLGGVVFSEPGIAWAVGDAGMILRSVDDGNSWFPVASGTSTNLNAVAFANNLEGWIVGDSGLILSTSDGGAIWSAEASQVSRTLYSLSVIDAANVWAVGDNRTILYRNPTSTLTPHPWINKSLGGTDQFKRIVMNDATHGWIASNNNNVSPVIPALLWTSDSWQTVQTVSIPSGVGALSSIFFLPMTSPTSSIDGWAVGDADTGTGNGTILSIHSDDLLSPGAVTKQNSGVLTDLSDIYFSDLNSGWAVGKDGTILSTSNGGITWNPTTYASAPLQRLEALAFNSGVGVTVGRGGVLVAKGSGGTAPWVTISGGPRYNLNAIAFAPDGVNGWAVGETNTILNTSNGGISWGMAPGTYAGSFNGVSAITSSDVWAVTSGKQIYHYNGSVWSLNTTLVGVGILKGVYFPDATYGWAVGNIDTNEVYYYNGSSWTSQGFCSTSTTMNSVYFIDGATPPTDSEGWVVGTGGIVGHTTNGGSTWTCKVVGNNAFTWNSVYFIDALNGWVVGNSGKIYHTSNGGVTWLPQTSHTGAALNGIRFSDANTGWAVGSGGAVIFTIDGGATWTNQMSGTAQDLKGIAFFKNINNVVTDIWAVGSKSVLSGDPPLGGAIIHTITGGN